MQILESDFQIRLDFPKDDPNPSDLFAGISDLIKAFESIDQTFIGTTNLHIEPVLALENIKEGSIQALFKHLLEKLPDEDLRNLDIKRMCGALLVEAKWAYVDFINNKTGISSGDEIKSLKSKMFDIARDSKLIELHGYSPPEEEDLVNNLHLLSSAVSKLDSNKHKLEYISQQRKSEINLNFKFDKASFEDLYTSQTLVSPPMPMILLVKKPDMLGESKWEFKHERKSIEAKIADEKFLSDYHSRRLLIAPGDAISALVEITTKYDHKNRVLSASYVVKNVKDIYENQVNEL